MMTRQAQYLNIKQKLDSYNISTTFPLQMMPLLENLLKRLDLSMGKSRNQQLQRLNNQTSSSTEQVQLVNSLIPKALRSQMSKTIQQSNQLHLELVTLKQELQSCKHYIDKHAIQKSDNKEEIKHIIAFKNLKEQDLVEQLQLVKFKFNQLIDFIHDNDTLEKVYLKKLLNHKRFQSKSQQDGQINNVNSINHSQNQSRNGEDLNSRVTFNKKSSSRHKQPRTKVNKTLQHNHNHRTPVSHQTLEQKIEHLSDKLHNRENQIRRLHALTTNDGLNLSKVLTQFNAQMQRNTHSQIQHRVSLLEQENHNLKSQLLKNKSTSGRYQALRDQVDKCHQVIKSLKEQNLYIKRSMKENNFDLQKNKKQINRQINIFNSKTVEVKVTKFNDDSTIQDLRNKVEFYEKQFGATKKQHEVQNKSSKKSIKIKNFEKKIKSVKQQKEAKKGSQIRQKYEDQVILNDKSKNKEKLINKSEKKENTKTKAKRQSKLNNLKNRPIIQIPEQSQQSSIEQGQQKKYDEQLNQKASEENLQQKKELSSQSEQQQSLQQVRNQTLIEQYEQTIYELTTRCLQQREELELKNNTIKGLEQIANRFIKRDEQQNSHFNSHSQPQNDNTQAYKHQISKLKKQVQSLSALLNQSEFQKNDLCHQFISMHELDKKLLIQNQSQSYQSNVIEEYKQKIQQLQQLLNQKDKKITDMREDNVQTQDKMLKSLDRIRRLNDQIETLSRQKEQAAEVIRNQREKHSTTIELSQIEKDEIILLRRNLLASQNKIEQFLRTINDLKNKIYILDRCAD